MKFNYDTIADAAYLKMNEGKIAKTIEIKNGVVVDVGKKGNIIGIEILNFLASRLSGGNSRSHLTTTKHLIK